MNTIDRLKDIDMQLYRLTIDLGEHIPDDAEYTELFYLWEHLLDLEGKIARQIRNIERLLKGDE